MNKQSLLYMSPIATFYDTKADVIENNLKRHEELFSEDRELYTYLLYFNNAKYYSKKLIISNLLKNSLYKEGSIDKEMIKIEDYLIYRALLNENITHALKMLLDLKENKINNNRTSKLILKFLFKRGNLDFICIKYKSKIKSLLIHALGLSTINKILNGDKTLFDKKMGVYGNPYAYECFLFVFNKDYDYKSEYLKTYLQAKDIICKGASLKIKKGIIPIEVLEGFVHDSNKYFDINSIYEVANISAKQIVQKQKVLETKDIKEIEIDYSKLDSIDLIKLIYNGTLSEEKLDEVYKQLFLKVPTISDFISDMEKTAFVFDFSLSLEGSSQNKYNAFYKEMELYYSLEKKYSSNIFFVGGEKRNNLIYPSGDSNISLGVFSALKKGFDKIIIVSDGFENVGSLEDIYNRLLQLEYKVDILHLNPVFSAKDMDFKILGNNISTIPFDKVSDLEFLDIFSLLEKDSDKFKKIMKDKILKEITINDKKIA